MHKNQVETDRKYKERQAAAGMKRITLMAPVANHEELKQIAAAMRKEAKGSA